MVRRSVARRFPLEWKTDVMSNVAATVTRGEFDLDLLPDEIAEIVKIDSTINWEIVDETDTQDAAQMYLSMDPDADDTPLTTANLEDLEVFFHHFHDLATLLTTSGKAVVPMSHNKISDFFAEPILIGTNFAQVAVAQATEVVTFVTTVYFRRKRATASELNQILLKRR